MKLVRIESHPSGRFIMPKRCPGCGQLPKKAATTETEIKVERRSPVSSDQGSLSVNLCDECEKKVSSTRMMTNIGWALIGIGFLGPIFLGMTTPPQMAEVAVSFCAGLALLWWADRSKKKRVGVRCKRLSDKNWEFLFENDVVADEFQEANPPKRPR